MKNYRSFLLGSFLLIAFQHVGQADATDCLEMDVNAQELVQCCRYESFFSDEDVKKCYESFSSQTQQSSAGSLECFVECAFTNMGALKENDVIDPEPLYGYYARFDSSYREVLVKAISSCASIQDDIRQELTLRNCPADRWKSSLLCNKLRAGVPPC